MTDHAAARRARANALDAARNHAAIAESRLACLPHAARQIEECVEIDGHLFFVPGVPLTPHGRALAASPESAERPAT
jgi:hypothetical protein